MTVIICLDDRFGMTFNDRRQSRDRRVTDDVLRMTDGKRLYISPFSEKLFSEHEGMYILDAEMMKNARSGEYCFVENIALKPYISRIERIIIYHWNRTYPSDFSFDVDLVQEGFSLAFSEEFEGFSHEKITKEIFVR